MKTKRAMLIAGLVAIGVSLGGLTTSQADKGRKFSNKDLRGDYGFVLDGEAVAGPIVGPVAGVGSLTNDKNGNSRGVRTLSVAGVVVLRQTAAGTVDVNPDGTGTAEYVVTTVDPMGFPDAVETFDFVLVDGGKELHFVSTTPGVVARGVSKRQ